MSAEPGSWVLTGNSGVPGWLPIPSAPADPSAWVRACALELRASWGDRWTAWCDTAVPVLLQQGLRSRPADAAHAFQLWPVAAPLVAQVHTRMGRRPPGFTLGPGQGIPYQADGLGGGVQTVQRARIDGVDGVGISVVFLADDVLIAASLLPTVPQVLPLVVDGFHAFVQSLTLSDPDELPIRAATPAAFPETMADSEWIDTVTPA